MGFNSTEELDLERIRREFNITEARIKELPIAKSELDKIYRNFQTDKPQLETIKSEILTKLNEKLSGKVHSIRCRIKDKDHLIEKIIRNIYDKPSKYQELSADNYYKIITDLIGVRIIILDKRDWREVHNSLLQIFRNIPERYAEEAKDIITQYDRYDQEANAEGKEFEHSYHAERPNVYITSRDDRELYQDDYLHIDDSKTHYRSIHYIVRYKFAYFEIQVRTLFEEGWLEFDHRIKYPYDQHNRKKIEYAGVLNSLAVAADRLIAFYDETDFKRDIDGTVNEEEKSVEKLTGAYQMAHGNYDEKMISLF